MKDFLAAIASRGKPVADIEQGYISTASCLLANLSLQLGRTLTWDPQAGKVVGDEEANRRLTRPYRSPGPIPSRRTSKANEISFPLLINTRPRAVASRRSPCSGCLRTWLSGRCQANREDTS